MKAIGVGIALVGAVVVLPGNGWAQCPLPTPVSFDDATVVPIGDAPACAGIPAGTPVDRLLTVGPGFPTFLTDVNLRVNITHPCPGDLQLTLTSPQGTVVSLVTNLGGDNVGSVFCFGGVSVLAGTTFDDDADPAGSVPYTFNNLLATDISPAFNAVAPFLVPEEALAAFYGENPNGNWTLRVVDTCNGDTGALNNWGLDVAALPFTPIESSVTFAQAGGPIPDPGVLVSNLAAADPLLGTFLTDVEALTSISHPNPESLQFALRSPSGTVVTLSTNNGLPSSDNTFNPTLWDDQANPGGAVPHLIVGGNPGVASDHPYGLGPASPLVPEEAMGAFYGEDPTGTWSLAIADNVPPVSGTPSAGTLSNWNLVLTSGVCPTPTNTPPGPTATPTPTRTVTPGGPTVTPVGPTQTPGPSPTPTPTIVPVICNGLPATIVGTAGNDLIIGTSTDDVIHGLAGDDIIKGRPGSDMICGGGGNDVLRGNKDDDLIKGGTGRDELRGGGARDVLLGGRGNDFLDGGDEDDTCIDNKGSNALVNCEGP